MEFKTIIKFSLIHLVILTFGLFLLFNDKENGDMSVVVLGTFIYLPYLLCLTFLNSTLLTLWLNYFKTNILRWFAAILTLLILTVWFLISGGQLEIHFWKVRQTEFVTLNLILLFLNLATVYFVTKRKFKAVGENTASKS